MTTDAPHSRRTTIYLDISDFWKGDLGLTLITICVVTLVFLVTPLHEEGLRIRFVFDLILGALMVFGAVKVGRRPVVNAMVAGLVVLTAVVLLAGRIHPTPAMHQAGSILATITLLVYVRIVLVLMFRGGPVTWSRIQGGVAACLLLAMAWGSAYQVVEQFSPGAFQFVTPPQDFDQLISKMTYYSFCTLTTLGSNIAPLHPFARSLTMAEAVVGQLFPAILISAIVAMAMRSGSSSQAA
jgi:hypothetical protein